MDSQDSSEDEDVFECGRCREKFSSLEEFMEHKNKRICRKPKGESSISEGASLAPPGEEPGQASGNDNDRIQGDSIIMAASIASGIDNMDDNNHPPPPPPTSLKQDNTSPADPKVQKATTLMTWLKYRWRYTTSSVRFVVRLSQAKRIFEIILRRCIGSALSRWRNYSRKNFLKHNRSKHHLVKLQQQIAAEAPGKRLKKCSNCQFSANSAKELTDHIKKSHSIGIRESEQEVPQKRGRGRQRKIRPLVDTDAGNETGSCPECEKLHPECSECGKAVLQKALYRHQRRCINKKHLICPLCQHQSRERYDYTVHVNNHKTWLPADPGDVVMKLEEHGAGEDAHEQNGSASGNGNSSQSQDMNEDIKPQVNQDSSHDTISTLDLSVLGLTPTTPMTGQEQNGLAVTGIESNQSITPSTSTDHDGGMSRNDGMASSGNTNHSQDEAVKPHDSSHDTISTLDLSVLGLTPTTPTTGQDQNGLAGIDSNQSAIPRDEELSQNNATSSAGGNVTDAMDGDEQRNTRQKQLKCHSCDNWFQRSNIKQHMFTVHNLVKKFQCRVESCMQAATAIENFLEHVKAHENFPSFSCGCRNCIIRNANTDNPEYITMLKKQKLKEYYQGMEYKCNKCWVKFPTAEGLEKHNRKETHSHPCPVCGKVQVSKRQLRMHTITHLDERNFLCEECGASFKTKRDLSKHHMSHSDFKPFVCQECGKGFLFKNKLDRHRMTVHSNEKPFKCTIPNCDKAFSRRDKLNDHARTHLYYEPFHCRFCPKGFFRKDNLKDHEVLHTKDYRFKCDRCPKGFMRPKLLARHIVHEHQVPDELEGANQISPLQQEQTVPMKLTKPKSKSRSKHKKTSLSSSLSPEAQTQNLSSQITYMIYQQAAGSSMAAALQQAMQSVNAGPEGCPVTLPAEVLQAYHLTQQATKEVQHNFQVTPVVAAEEQILPEALHDRTEFRLA
ncbi:uncharacterized protein [Amphiura filiformis]|uniref:uncharacterized protein n=1 Tax=Amphiura filiformis TaxID=82378 RepID=UPI003B2124CB